MYSKSCIITFILVSCQDEVQKMRESMAEFRGHLENYDSQLNDVTKKAGDAILDVTKIGERVTLFDRNLTSLRGGLDSLQREQTEADSNLDLLAQVSLHSHPCLCIHGPTHPCVHCTVRAFRLWAVLLPCLFYSTRLIHT